MSEVRRDRNKLDMLEIRSEEMQEIMGYVPRWIVRWGISVITASIILLLVGAWFFKYPDIVNATVVVLTENPPAPVVAQVAGRLSPLLAADNQELRHGELIAVIANPASYRDVLRLKEELGAFRPHVADPISGPVLARDLRLGELQPAFEQFFKICSDFIHFQSLSYHQARIVALEGQITGHGEALGRLERQAALLAEEYELGRRRFQRREELHRQGIISIAEIESARAELLQREYSLESTKNSIVNEKLQISRLRESKADLQLQYREQKNRWATDLKQALDNLLSQIEQWEHRFLLKAPLDGRLSFTTFWSENQFVQAGATVFTVVPAVTGEIVGRLLLPIAGSGKVKAGQQVNIKFANFPHTQYGMVTGRVRSISLVPAEQAYLVDVEFPTGLRTNYGRELDFSQQMQGGAEIITEKMRALERMLQPLRAKLKQ